MKKIIWLSVMAFLVLQATAQDWAKARLEKSPRHQEWQKIENGQRKVESFVVYPEVKDKATAVIVIDRVTKIVVEQRFGVPYGPRQIIDHILFLTVTRNAGAAFGLFQTFTLGFLLISAVVIAGILIYYWRLPPHDWPARLGLALVLGGAIANAYDRGVKGSVIDFIQIPHWPIFNVADSAITVGVAVLLLGTLRRGGRPRRS